MPVSAKYRQVTLACERIAKPLFTQLHMLYLALSCLQGRPIVQAFHDLRSLGVPGIQLTPGNVPDPAFAEQLDGVPVRTHHGFSWEAMRQRVWDDLGVCCVAADSVHPPQERDSAYIRWWQAIRAQTKPAIYETMYPGYRLGCGAEIERAMDEGLNLAVDARISTSSAA